MRFNTLRIDKFILWVFIFLIPSTAFSQEEIVWKERKEGFRKQLRRTTNEQINLLHDGALLVRLQAKKRSIDGLRERGNFKLADRVEAEQRELNQKIVNGFTTYFDFCPVYFFYSSDSKYVKNGELNRVGLLNQNLEVDTGITVDARRYLTAEFGKIQQGPGKYYENYKVIQGDGDVRMRKQYYGEPDMGFGALIIKNDDFVQLRKPFPYYVRTLSSFIFFRRKPKKTVKRMNKKLQRFYLRSNR